MHHVKNQLGNNIKLLNENRPSAIKEQKEF